MTPVGPDRTVEQVLVREIRKSIIEGQLPPGMRLPYRELARSFEVSVTPVRVALRELANQGLVDIRPHGGARVTALSLEELEEVYVTRIALEGWLAKLGAARLGDDDMELLSARFQDVEQAAEAGDRGSYLSTAWTFRRICYAAAQRPRISETLSVLWERCGRYNYLTLGPDYRMKESVWSLREFHSACRGRDGDRASEVISAALQRSFDFLIDAFSEQVEQERASLEAASPAEAPA